MALSDEQVDWLEKFFEACEQNEGKLGNWESSFVADMKARFEKYRDTMFVSDKQGNQLRRIWGKVTGNDQGF